MDGVGVRDQARLVLREFWDAEHARLGKTPASEEFFPIALQGLARQRKWEVEATDGVGGLPDGRELLGKLDRDKRIIYVSSRLPVSEQRFTIAHELGHAVLGHPAKACAGSSAWRVRSSRGKRDGLSGRNEVQYEAEADRFAAELLMPAKTVSERFKTLFGKERLWAGSSVVDRADGQRKGSAQPRNAEAAAAALAVYAPDGSLPSLAAFFGVSREAMTIRLLELRLVHN